MRAFIDQQRNAFGVEPLCKVLQVAPSAYRRHAALVREPHKRCARAKRDELLMPQIQRVWQANMQVYGADKVWRQLAREGVTVARCTVERLMRSMGLRGVMRGKAVRTTVSDGKAPCPLDRVNRQFRAERPNQLWVSDFTYVSTWQGWLYVAFVIDVFARRIVGWRVSSSMRTDFVLDALEQALYARQPERDGSLVCHSDRGSQYVSIRYTERLAEADTQALVLSGTPDALLALKLRKHLNMSMPEPQQLNALLRGLPQLMETAAEPEDFPNLMEGVKVTDVSLSIVFDAMLPSLTQLLAKKLGANWATLH